MWTNAAMRSHFVSFAVYKPVDDEVNVCSQIKTLVRESIVTYDVQLRLSWGLHNHVVLAKTSGPMYRCAIKRGAY